MLNKIVYPRVGIEFINYLARIILKQRRSYFVNATLLYYTASPYV